MRIHEDIQKYAEPESSLGADRIMPVFTEKRELDEGQEGSVGVGISDSTGQMSSKKSRFDTRAQSSEMEDLQKIVSLEQEGKKVPNLENTANA